MKGGRPGEEDQSHTAMNNKLCATTLQEINYNTNNTLPQPCISEIANHGDNYPARTQSLLALPLDIEIHISS